MTANRRKRVAHFVRKFLPHFTSFVRNQIMNHVRYEPMVVYKEYIDSLFAREITNSISFLPLDNNKGGFEKLYSDLLYSRPFRMLSHRDKRNVREFLLDKDIDILHFHYGTDAGFFVSALDSVSIPSLVSFYGYDCSSFPRWYFGLGTRYLRKVFSNVDYCLAMSEDMKCDLLKIGCPLEKIITHYYGTDVQRFFQERIYQDKNEIIFLSIGYLVPQKGHAFTLRAFKEFLRLTNKKVQLRIVGAGYLESHLKKFVLDNGLSENVQFVGALKHLSPVFLGEYRKADIFVHPSVTSRTNEKEGIPGAIVEAMAAGLPVISTYHAGIPNVIRDGETGLLVNEWDVDSLVRSMCILAENVKVREKIGLRAQRYALNNLDLKHKQIELESIYDRILDEASNKIRCRKRE